MKTSVFIDVPLSSLAVALLLYPCFSSSAQTLADYQGTIASASPDHWYQFAQTTSDSGSGSPAPLTLGGAGYATDYFGNGLSDLSINSFSDDARTSVDIINGGGSGANAGANATGTLILLFRTSAVEVTGAASPLYLFRDQSSGASNALALDLNTDGTDGNSLNRLQMNIGNLTGTVIATSVPFDTWYFFACSWNEANDAAEVSIYFGAAGAGGSLVGNTRNLANDAVFGANGVFCLGNFSFTSPTGGFNGGHLDEFATFNTQLTSPQINSMYAALVTVPEPATITQIIAAGIFLFRRRLPAQWPG